MAALLEADWTTPSLDYDTLLRVTRKITRDQQAVERLFLRMVFNVVAHNRDDHAKQHAFLMDETGAWTLAPPYDLTFSRGPGGEHYLAVGRHSGDDITLDDLVALGASQGMSDRDCRDCVNRTCEVVSRFRTFAATYGVTAPTLRATAASLNASLKRLNSVRIQGVTGLGDAPDVPSVSDQALAQIERGIKPR